ncbi:MAG: hypothetical protein ABR899_01085 [Candidatus Krumholzibacteriaceae bacterium]|jgi:hypothetical protein
MENVVALQQNVTARKFVLRVLAGWLAMIALDLLLNAGLFAKLWLVPSSFLLSPEDLFRRLPLGYAAFLLQAVAYVWLTKLIGAGTWRRATIFGLKLGALLGVASVLGLRSGTTASWTVLLATWLVGETVLTTGACFMAGLAAERGEKRALLSALILLVCAFIVIAVLQSTGLVPAKHVG